MNPSDSTREHSPQKDMIYSNGLGGFSRDGKTYNIRLEKGMTTPAPWINVIANPDFGFMVSESGGGFTWCKNSRENKVSPWSNDPVGDPPGEVFYIRDEDKTVWSLTALPVREEEPYTVKHGFGYSEFKHTSHGITQSLVQFVPVAGPVKISLLTLWNDCPEDRNLTITYYLSPVMGVNPQETAMHLVTSQNARGALLTENPYNQDFPGQYCFMESSVSERTVTGNRKEFFGRGKSDAPESLQGADLSGTVGAGYDPCAAMQVKIMIPAQESVELVFLLGMADTPEETDALCDRFRSPDAARDALDEVKVFWQERLQVVQVNTPDPSMNFMLNGWLQYQVISCRLWARSGFYQAGGAFGFRDQLQDSLSIASSWPQLARDQILRHAGHQFVEGDVLHWWHEPAGKGTRTRISDDYLWLPFVTAEYARITGDQNILEEELPFLQDDLLKEHEDERYCTPRVTSETASLYEHCLRSLENGLKFGEHGLPLMGSGDWNDGMNTVGNQGRGESVWLGWFLCSILDKWIPLVQASGDQERAQRYASVRLSLAGSIEEHGWDGNWYRRAYFDDGAVLGSANNRECRIDSLAQSWAVISGAGDPLRAAKAMDSLEDYLVLREEGLIKLLSPPFNGAGLEPGYIKGYVPGVRENGGQYSHAAAWVVMAAALSGDGNKAWDFFSLINPINHARTNREVSIYKVEPYVMAADVYGEHPHTGRGGWTWYTGAAGWMYKAGLESILGFNRNGERLVLEPCIPEKWVGYTITYRYMETVYTIAIRNPEGCSRGTLEITLDGLLLTGNEISLVNDQAPHSVDVLMKTVLTEKE